MDLRFRVTLFCKHKITFRLGGWRWWYVLERYGQIEDKVKSGQIMVFLFQIRKNFERNIGYIYDLVELVKEEYIAGDRKWGILTKTVNILGIWKCAEYYWYSMESIIRNIVRPTWQKSKPCHSSDWHLPLCGNCFKISI